MSDGEIVAWQSGVDWGREGLTASDWGGASYPTLAVMLGPAGAAALTDLGRDVFAYWWRLGLDDYERTRPG